MALSYLSDIDTAGSNAHFSVVGDGTSSSIDIALDKSPIGMLFNGHKATSIVTFVSTPAGASATLGSDGRTVTVSFATAPASGDETACNLFLGFDGE